MRRTQYFSKTCLLLSLAAGLLSSPVSAQTEAQALPSVNGEKLSLPLFEGKLRAALRQGQSDTPQLRQAIAQELINRQLLLQEATQQGLEKDNQFQQALRTVREDLLVDRLLAEASKTESITDAELRAEYNRQIAALGPAGDVKEYAFSIIITATEAQAREVLTELKKGAAFDKLAKEKSTDPSSERGGSMQWLLPQQIHPTVSNVLVNLQKGTLAVSPIETQNGWVVLRMDDARPYKAPSLQEAKPRLMQAVAVRKRAELIEKLRAKAQIKN